MDWSFDNSQVSYITKLCHVAYVATNRQCSAARHPKILPYDACDRPAGTMLCNFLLR